ncbi:MAG: ribosome-associated translation inhibitor RaiA [Anaerolineaceae bacterium]|nr:ribosome-associated translation inhibitor RaiA [Anaerolineaceae bacterium]
MNITIKGRNVKVTESIEKYARKKVEHFDRYLPNIVEARVDLNHEHTRRGEDLVAAQITIRHSRGAILRTEERTTGDIMAAINGAVENMHRRIQRFKSKRNRKGKERFSASIEELNAAEAIPDVEEFVDEAPTEVLRHKEIPVVAMNEAEAVEQMELLGHAFFMFFNGDTGSVNVLYKRSSGGYGVLVPKVN